tara:strand:- start:659 stop:928 length:270 start_codon:yes stop_codon:yes gene_type:complete
MKARKKPKKKIVDYIRILWSWKFLNFFEKLCKWYLFIAIIIVAALQELSLVTFGFWQIAIVFIILVFLIYNKRVRRMEIMIQRWWRKNF